MFSRKVFCGATSPLLPPCILRLLGSNSELVLMPIANPLGSLRARSGTVSQTRRVERLEHPVWTNNKSAFVQPAKFPSTVHV